MITDSSNNTIKTIKTIKTINFNDDCINSTLVLSTTPNRRQLSNLPECPATRDGEVYFSPRYVTLWHKGAYVIQHTEISNSLATENTQTYLCTGRAKGTEAGVPKWLVPQSRYSGRNCGATSPETSTAWHSWTPTGHHHECFFGCTECMLRRSDCPFGQYQDQDQASHPTCKKCTASNFDVTIGSTSYGSEKTITTSQHGDIECPPIVDWNIHRVLNYYGDRFAITVNGSKITALRTDGGPGWAGGWGLNLEFPCKITTGGKSSIYCWSNRLSWLLWLLHILLNRWSAFSLCLTVHLRHSSFRFHVYY
jgi:hypothetical protein